MKVCKDAVSEVRDSSVILAEMIGAVQELESLRDDEWGYMSDHGHNRECWSGEEEGAYHRIVDDIQKARSHVRSLAREATGDQRIDI